MHIIFLGDVIDRNVSPRLWRRIEFDAYDASKNVNYRLRGHVNKKNKKKTLEVRGWVKCPISNKKIGKHIFINYFITFFGEHSNVNNVMNVLLCLCSCFYVHVFVVNYF